MNCYVLDNPGIKLVAAYKGSELYFSSIEPSMS